MGKKIWMKYSSTLSMPAYKTVGMIFGTSHVLIFKNDELMVKINGDGTTKTTIGNKVLTNMPIQAGDNTCTQDQRRWNHQDHHWKQGAHQHAYPSRRQHLHSRSTEMEPPRPPLETRCSPTCLSKPETTLALVIKQPSPVTSTRNPSVSSSMSTTSSPPLPWVLGIKENLKVFWDPTTERLTTTGVYPTDRSPRTYTSWLTLTRGQEGRHVRLPPRSSGPPLATRSHPQCAPNCSRTRSPSSLRLSRQSTPLHSSRLVKLTPLTASRRRLTAQLSPLSANSPRTKESTHQWKEELNLVMITPDPMASSANSTPNGPRPL